MGALLVPQHPRLHGLLPGPPGKALAARDTEIAIQFNDDFIEWSISFAQKPFPDACVVAKEVTRQSIVNAK